MTKLKDKCVKAILECLNELNIYSKYAPMGSYIVFELDNLGKDGSFIAINSKCILYFFANHKRNIIADLTIENAKSMPYELKFLGLL